MTTDPRQDGFAPTEYGSDVIVDAIRALGIEYISMNPGATFRGIHDSMVNHLGNQGPEFILCNHEEIAVALAQGYGRAAGKPMAAFVHDIVGLLHASMAMFNAWMGRSGVLVLGATGPLDANHRRPWIDWIHTANVQGEAVRNFVKWDDQPTSVEASVESLIRAYNLVVSEPQGPVYVCFDADVQEMKLSEPFQMPDVSRFPAPTRLQADPAALEQAASALMAAERPVVLANFLGRSEEAAQGLLRLAESLALPVINGGDFFNFPTRHPLYAAESRDELLAEADVVLALDVYDLQQELTRLDRATRKTEDILRPDAMLIDISLRQLQVKSWADDHGSLYPTAMSIAADTALATPALADLVQRRLDDAAGSTAAIAARRDRIAQLSEAALARNQATARARSEDHPLALSTIAQELWEVVRDYDWVVGNGDLRGWVQRLWDIKHPYQDVSARGGGGLGEGLPHAVGVALANRDKGRLTINIQSDGDMLFTPAAIWTAVHHRIPLLIVMYNNRTYGNDLGHQGSMAQVRGRPMERRTIGIDIDDPVVDFAGLARSFGAYAEGPIERAEDLQPAFRRAVDAVVNEGRVALVDMYTQVV
ncbi:MAG: thiamine pyrophosphate-binding protein [Chloroflexota bacterium]|nr:thiamine pyrophosphate-binding protein [Chloroflexota bacterium]MDE2969400.1 thiamine pyrophosphate-binding protein [Chloroflexota bacterium]